MRGALLTVLSAGAFLQCLDSATLPPNPCPNLFQYQQEKNGDVFARVMLDNDNSGDYDISVNMSIAAHLLDEQTLKIERESTLDDILTGCPLVYNISFPIQGVIPMLTRIELNNKVYCTGPSEKLRPGKVTEMWGSYCYRTNQPTKPLPAKPQQKLHPGCTLLRQQPPLHKSTTFPSKFWQPPLTDSPLPSWNSQPYSWRPYSTVFPIPASSSSNPWQQPSAAPTTSALLSSSTWQPTSTASRTDTPLPSWTLQPYSWRPHSTVSPTPASSSSNPWQQPSEAPTTSALLSSSSWKPPLTASRTDTPLPSWTLQPYSWRPHSTVSPSPASSSSNPWQQPSEAPTNSVLLSSSSWKPPLTASWTSRPRSRRPSSTAPTTATPLSSSTWQSPSSAATTSAPMSTEPSMHSPQPIQVLDWLWLSPSVAATTAASWIEEFSLSVKDCGLTMVNSRSSVIDGDDFVDGQFPWLVAIMYRSNFDYNYKCTGTLVSNRHVITAGHCVKRNKEIGNFLLTFGTKNLAAHRAVQRELQNINVHPDYTDNKDDANVALLTVKNKIEFGASIKPVCLWHEGEYANRMAGMQGTAVGWWMDAKRKFVDAKKIDLPIVSQTKCLQSFPNLSSVVSSRTFCAGLKDVGPCHGDSGAGFAMQINGRWTLKGVVFTAVGDLSSCEDDIDNYFVFVDVDKVMSWLKKVMM